MGEDLVVLREETSAQWYCRFENVSDTGGDGQSASDVIGATGDLESSSLTNELDVLPVPAPIDSTRV